MSSSKLCLTLTTDSQLLATVKRQLALCINSCYHKCLALVVSLIVFTVVSLRVLYAQVQDTPLVGTCAGIECTLISLLEFYHDQHT